MEEIHTSLLEKDLTTFSENTTEVFFILIKAWQHSCPLPVIRWKEESHGVPGLQVNPGNELALIFKQVQCFPDPLTNQYTPISKFLTPYLQGIGHIGKIYLWILLEIRIHVLCHRLKR